MKDTRIKKTCEKCGKDFLVQSCRADSAKYCSKECWSSRNPPTSRKCACCGKEFNSRDKKSLFCSRSCSRKSLVGEKATAWKGGSSLDRLRAKEGGKLKEWRIAVYKRDNYTCQKCGQKGTIHAHHIKPFAGFPELRFDVNNGIAVCVHCHEKIHGRKISAPTPFPKKCADCGRKTTGRSEKCRSCSIKHYHSTNIHKREKTCPQCGKFFVALRSDYKYCSVECRKNASHDSHDVRCCVCGKTTSRIKSTFEKSKSGKWYCSDECHNKRPSNNIELDCPCCGKKFTVKPYRVKTGKIITCSRKCAHEQIKHSRLST